MSDTLLINRNVGYKQTNKKNTQNATKLMENNNKKEEVK